MYDRKPSAQDAKIWDNATKISRSEAFEKFKCLYVDNLNKYVFDKAELEITVSEFLDVCGDISALRIYGTTSEGITLDADFIIENACEELHEDAIDFCDVKKLQDLLDRWCANQTGTITYYPCYEIGVLA